MPNEAGPILKANHAVVPVFGLDNGSSGLKKLFYFSLFAGPRLQRRQYSNPVHLNSPRI